MAERHIRQEALERFLRLEASQEESKRLVRHLLTGCAQCSDLALRITSETGLFAPLKPDGRSGWEQAYEEVFVRTLTFASEEEHRLAVEKLRGWAQWAELEPMTPQSRFTMVESNSGLHTFGLHERLLEAARWYSRTEPAEAVDIIRLAIVVAERLDPATIGDQRLADLKAAAWAALGNAQRIANDFEGARRAFNEAWRMLESGTGVPAEEANLISLEASYMRDIGEFEMAESTLEEALQLYRKTQDTHLQGRILFKMGDAIGYVNPERGISHIQKAVALIDASREPRLELCARHDLALFLTESGRPEEALAVLERARPLYRQFQDDLTQLRLHWVEGKIAFRLKEYDEAESIFGQIWDEFRARNLNQEVVLVTIDLAWVLAAKGEPARAAQLAAECYSIMKNWGLHKDALAAWLVFQDALSQERGMAAIFERVGEYYRRHWFLPARFEPSEL
ncbi:MAG TPA: tetratricopeptide repeat protein [Thermoanaerobaculia bacterium]|jgi:tetratricopeptide (TPR) repeat protein|nr:tetratricopeptide repeat protein [Thermoanaerobaculia bacterium]